MDILTRRKFRHLVLTGEFFITVFFLSCAKDCIEDMVTFTASAKIFPPNFSKVAGLVSILSSENFHVYDIIIMQNGCDRACREIHHSTCVRCGQWNVYRSVIAIDL